ncbi:uncharacterized protein LOC129741032 isoform X2 [Uranotaenia lowii]|uniref:uncharacterized protein LOC129741032 isoform X2 n=1 Tax=Uranotaenia lowii TaxID=190385 RepID=UPI002479B5EA|nr:uncharacterized protein LOC129741032 isoform X2 [Uranotaenia lowii]
MSTASSNNNSTSSSHGSQIGGGGTTTTNSSNLLSSNPNIVILENQILDSNDVVAAASLQQLSNANALKMTRECSIQYSNMINSYSTNSNANSATNSNNQLSTVNIIPGDSNQSNSRVQVLSNVQLVSSKGNSQPPTFSYVDASGKNFNVLTSSGKISTNKLISVPITKVKPYNHIGQQQQQSAQQQTQLITTSAAMQQYSQQTQPLSSVQKVTVPRSIQLVTRIPNSTISVSNGRVSQITSAMNSTQPQPLQHQQPTSQYTVHQYQETTNMHIPAGLEVKSSTLSTAAMINSSNTIGKINSTKNKSTASYKMLQNTTIAQNAIPKPSGKSVSVSLKTVRNNTKMSSSTGSVNSQYYIKSSTASGIPLQQPATSTSIYTTSPAQAVYHNPIPLPVQQQQPQMSQMQISVGTPATTSKTKGIYKSSKNQLIQIPQQQPPPNQSPLRSVTPSSANTLGTITSAYGTTTTIASGGNTSSSHYQARSLSSITNTSYHQPSNNLYTGTSAPLYEPPMSVMHSTSSSNSSDHQTTIPSVTVTGYTATSRLGRKYANTSDGNQLQTNSPIKIKNVGRGRNSSSSYQTDNNSSQKYSASPSRPQTQYPTSVSYGTNSVQQQQQQQPREDPIYINGQQMTDEASARMLQSLSQKSSVTDNSSSGGKVGSSSYKQSSQLNFYGSDSAPLASTSSSSTSNSAASAPNVIYDPSDARFYDDKQDKRSSTSEIITYAGNIPLREGFPPSYNYNHREDDDLVGVEVRPAPVDTSNGRYYVLQAVLQDHTYFAPMPEPKLPETQATSSHQQLLPPVISSTSIPQQLTTTIHGAPSHMIQLHNISQQNSIQSSQPSQSHSLYQYIHQQQQLQSKSPVLSGTTFVPTSSVVSAPLPVSLNMSIASGSAPLTQHNLNALQATMAVTTTNSATPVCTSQIQPTASTGEPHIGGGVLDYIYQKQQQQQQQQDDDANSIISTGSRNFNNLDNDAGEETETAPEGEGEDDSITRCICDLTHDDGYMICCDKCSAWQHVDCMGIDRMNIPDEYNCEVCQPREVDRNRARMLQLEKRKEQSLFLTNNNLQVPTAAGISECAVSSTTANSASGNIPGSSLSSTISSGKGANQFTTGKGLGGAKKGKAASAASKKKTTSESSTNKKPSKKALESALNRINGKRKELKRPSKKKVKTVEQNAEKMTNMIRTWIDNYERAVTNHYSPELRARLQAFGKMQSQNPLLCSDRLIPATAVNNLVQKCTTVPHAGGKILISTGDIGPSTPIIEIRGKYMISSQHKPLQSLFNMAANGKLANNKNAGPFLFLYQVPNGGIELCVDTRTYGNDARFIRRSCRPNAEILHNVEKGVVHLYIVSTANIKANTEITIKHDEHLLQRVGGVIILTHTTVTNLCACGLIKECQYSAQLSEALLPTTGFPPNAPGTNILNSANPTAFSLTSVNVPMVGSTTTKTSKNKKSNGAFGDGEKKPTKKRNSRSTSSTIESRLRSISSSGDSTNEMMLLQQQQQQQQTLLQPPSIGPPQLSPMHVHGQFHQFIEQQQSQTNTLQFVPPQQQTTMSAPITPIQQQQQIMQSQYSIGQAISSASIQQHQQQPVYLYSPTSTSQSRNLSPHTTAIAPHMQSPQPMSPLGGNMRPGFYNEIKSPINSPPPPKSGLPALSVPSTIPPNKSINHQPLQSPMIPNLPEQQSANNSTHFLQTSEERQDIIQEKQQQQYLAQQKCMEDILRIKIKSPVASPIKQEPLTPTAINTGMLSPPPPPPIPLNQRIVSAENMKKELFHSHFQLSQPSIREPIMPLNSVLAQQQQQQQPQTSSQHQLQPPYISPIAVPPATIKIEYPKVEVKQESSYSSLSSIETEPITLPTTVPTTPIKDEKQIKVDQTVLPEPKIEPESLIDSTTVTIKKEEESDFQNAEYPPLLGSPAEEIKQEVVPASNRSSLPDSATNSPVKQPMQPGNNSSNNSTNSSPHSTHHQSSSKKKGSSKESHRHAQKEEKKPSRKLTREERKMEAIVKAFEKMEQSQQRKQELKEQRKEGKRRSVSSSTPDESGVPSGGSSSKKKSLGGQKRKKKKSKSMSLHFGSPNQSRKKKVSKTSKKSNSLRVRSLTNENSKIRPAYESGKAAELLLTFSQSKEPSAASFFGDDVKPLSANAETLENNTIDGIPRLSSACMLIEAAVAPLEMPITSPIEQDFKFPQKAKTKKSMSREWLSGQTGDTVLIATQRITPDQDSGYISEEKTNSTTFTRQLTTIDESVRTPLGVDVSEPNMCIAARKVEEFIAQSSPHQEEVGGQPILNSSTSVTPINTQELTPTAVSTASSSSESAAAKKRWLRQAISEETDELNQASSSPPPPNGFTTPLKKRRVVRQSEENNPNQKQQLESSTNNSNLVAAQKIDFIGNVQSQVISNYTDSGMYWSNPGISTLNYQTSQQLHTTPEAKQAMDLSRTAAVRMNNAQSRIQPYKIVPSLTPLHFADPDPLPVPSTMPLIAPRQPSIIPPPIIQNHQSQSVAESHPSLLLPPPVELPSNASTMYESGSAETIPASAVAAMVPASLLPPDTTYNTPVRIITRSKGSQKYIGSPAKFESSSPAGSQNSSVAETPEKISMTANSSCSTSVANSDVEEECAIEEPAVAAPSIPEESCIETMQSLPSNEIKSDVSGGLSEQECSEKTLECSIEQVSSAETIIDQEVLIEDEMVVEEEIGLMNTSESVECEKNNTSEMFVKEIPVEKSVEPVTEISKPLNGQDKSKATKVSTEEDKDTSEMEDLQKVIASFHSESIMNLISRNKKSKKSISRENSAERKKSRSRKNSKDMAVSSSKENSVTPPGSPSEDVLDGQEVVAHEANVDMCDFKSSEPESMTKPSSPPIAVTCPPSSSADTPVTTFGRSYSHPSWHSTDLPTIQRESSEISSLPVLKPDIPQLSYNSPSTYQSNAARNLLSSLSVGSEPLSTLGSYRPSSSSLLDFHKTTANIGSSTSTLANSNSTNSSSIYQYRPSSTEISNLLEKGFSSSRSSSLSTLGTDRPVGSSFLFSSPKVSENLSTLGGSANTPYPKIFTKTASSDPRLNPALTIPEPVAPITPKRKLSINEYRQRKMQSSSSVGSSGLVEASSACTTTTSSSSSSTVSSSNSSGSNSRDGGNNVISSSLGSNDVSSSISKELSLELELELNKLDQDNSEASSPNDYVCTTSATASSTKTETELCSSAVLSADGKDHGVSDKSG